MHRQVERTRTAITNAFTELVFSHNYEAIRMVDIARLANVGRSTVYLHYGDKDAVLIDTMDWILSGLSACANPLSPLEKSEELIRHIWLHRDKARKILFGTTGQKLERVLSLKIKNQFISDSRDSEWKISPTIAANQIAASLFSVLRSWVSAEASVDVAILSQHLHESANALRQAALARNKKITADRSD